MKLFFLLAFSLLITNAHGQAQINKQLKQQLDSVMVLDQQYRQPLSTLTTKEKTDSVARLYNIEPAKLIMHLSKMQEELDSSNLAFIEMIIKRYGYPGKTLVGTGTSKVAWFVLQHSQKIGEYLPIIKKAGKEGELVRTSVAMMEDRYLMYNGREQLYGSQASYRKLKNGVSETFIWPIKNPQKVNKRRKKIGFDDTIEEYAKRLHVIYRVVKLSEIE